MYSINIDAGGTMTDGLVLRGGNALTIKVDSTPHDLTHSMMDLIDFAATRLGYENSAAFLVDVDIIRWSSTVTSNVLAEQRGPKVGLLINLGEEETLFGEHRSPVLDTIISPDKVIGIDPKNKSPQPILDAVRKLLEDGVRRICVSLAGSFTHPELENSIKTLINEQYPDHYIGAVPVLLGHEMAQLPDDMTRTHYSLINAYVHPALASSLFKAEDRLKYEQNWNGALLVGHTSGGMARIGKTKAVDTIESGPVFGTYAGAYFARRYHLDSMLCIDVGGTTTKCSVVSNGAPVLQRGGDLFGIPLQTPLQLLNSVALGGGSVVHADVESRYHVHLGPESMGSSPGPACYGLGSEKATLTDCFVVLGYLDADNFLDGRRKLELQAAENAVANNVADKLDITVEQAALYSRDCAADMMASLVKKTAKEAGLALADLPLFAYGGNGPLLAAFVADKLDINQVYVSLSLGPVFSAFGTAIANVIHLYESGVGINGDDSREQIKRTLKSLKDRACRDLHSEGFNEKNAKFSAEIEADGLAAVPLQVDQITADLPQTRDGIIRLRAEYAVSSYEPSPLKQGDAAADAAKIAERRVFLTETHIQLPVFNAASLLAGNEITGPAMIVGGNLTCIVPERWKMTIDEHGNGLMQKN